MFHIPPLWRSCWRQHPLAHSSGIADGLVFSSSEHASTYYKEPWQQKFEQQTRHEMHSRKDWLGVDWAGKQARVLDYAAGPGTVSMVGSRTIGSKSLWMLTKLVHPRSLPLTRPRCVPWI